MKKNHDTYNRTSVQVVRGFQEGGTFYKRVITLELYGFRIHYLCAFLLF